MKQPRLLIALGFFAITSSHASPIFPDSTAYLSIEDSPFTGQAGGLFDPSDLGV